MSLDPGFRCSTCGSAALVDDEFCESCGSALAAPRDASRNHLEQDLRVVAAVTDRGLVHARNEDAVHVGTFGGMAVAVVCDGVSTSSAPQVASQVAADVAGRRLLDGLRDGHPAAAAVTGAVTAANDAVLDLPWLAHAGRDGPSCTMVTGVWDGHDITVGWLGDSRAYWLGAGGDIERLTADHSWAQLQVEAGRMSAEAAEADRRAHAITRWLGPDAPAGAAPTVAMRPAGAGRLLLCSDGLWNHVPDDDELSRLVSQRPDSAAIDIARALTRVALSRGGTDNVSVAVISVDPDRIDARREGA